MRNIAAGDTGIAVMEKFVTWLQTLTAYGLIACALAGTALGAVEQFYPIY
jgi:hypothetical protein